MQQWMWWGPTDAIMNVLNKLSSFLAVYVVYGYLLQSSYAGKHVILKALQNHDPPVDNIADLDELIANDAYKNHDPQIYFDERDVDSFKDPFRREYGSDRALYLRNSDKTNVKRGWEDISFVLGGKPPRKRGWEVINDEMSDFVGRPVLKRALEIVRELWKIPEIRESYKEYVRAGKRSKEIVVDIPVQSGSMNPSWMIDQIGYDDEGTPLYLSYEDSVIPEVKLDLSKRQLAVEDGPKSFDYGLNDPMRYSANLICQNNNKPQVPTYDRPWRSFVSPIHSLIKQGYAPKVSEELEDISTDSKRGWETLGWKRGFIQNVDESSLGYQNNNGGSTTGQLVQRPWNLLTLKQNGHLKRAVYSSNDEGVQQVDTGGFLINRKRTSLAEMFDGNHRLVSIPQPFVYPITFENKRGWESFKMDIDLSGSNARRTILTLLTRMRNNQHAKAKRGWEFVGGWKRSTRSRRSANANRMNAFANLYGPETKRAWEGIAWKRSALGINDNKDTEHEEIKDVNVNEHKLEMLVKSLQRYGNNYSKTS